VKTNQKINKINFLFLILFLFLTSLLTLKTFKKIDLQDIEIYGSELFSKQDIVDNSSLNFSTRLIFIKTKYIEQELKKNLSLKNVSVNRQILPFGLNIIVETRIPIAHGEQILNGQKVLGFIDEDGFFINKKYADKENTPKLIPQVFGWQNNHKKTLSEILTSQKHNDVEFSRITFSPSGFLILEERDLKTIIIGFNPNLIKSQLQIIINLKSQLKKNNILDKIDNIDLTDPDNPKIKVFKP
tara:strand:- start:567 stop:1292 length:726 start_codon:yes stop_codon:yes gene_type:complete